MNLFHDVWMVGMTKGAISSKEWPPYTTPELAVLTFSLTCSCLKFFFLCNYINLQMLSWNLLVIQLNRRLTQKFQGLNVEITPSV